MLPTSYVYLHRDPRNGEVRYVGAGAKGRAWQCTTSPNTGPRRGGRSQLHYDWLCSLFDLGYTMGDIVEVVAQGLHTSDARMMESELVRKQDPDLLFNIQTIPSLLALSEDAFRRAKKLRARGVSYENIGAALDVSAMTAYRALNNQTRGYQINGFAD